MATTKIAGRQHPLAALADTGIANIGAGNEVLIKLPPNCLLLDIVVLTVTAFDGTTNTLSVSDGTTTFVNAVDVKTTGSETVANAPKFYPEAATLTVSLAQTGTATAGRALVFARYVELGKADVLYRD